MSEKPTTPAEAAPLGSDPKVITPPSTPPTSVAAPEGKVTISTKEFAQLSRDAARGRSATKRAELSSNRGVAPAAAGDPTVADAIREANERAADAEKKVMQSEVRGGIRDLLEKDEFKSIPKSTRDLILKNPSVVSSAETVEEAMLDVEDYFREQVAEMGAPAAAAPQPNGHDAPPVINGGSPAPSKPVEPEDLSKLRGPARSQAAIRNALKTVK